MLPVVHTMPSNTPRPLLHVPFAYMMMVTSFVPVISLLTIAALGVLLHFDETTGTHCKVPNFVPSISAVVGGVTPERYIWRLGMAIFSFPRLFDSFLYYNFFWQTEAAISKAWYMWANRLAWGLHWGQYLALFGLTYVSSKENYLFHRNCFIGFIACSVIHMCVFLPLFKIGRQPATYRDKISFRLRVAFALSHVAIFFFSLYFFWRHNTFCEPYMYSYYGLCEYLVVLTNVAFHCVEAIDFQNDYYISIAPPSRLKHN